MRFLLIFSIFLIFPIIVSAQEINFLQHSYKPGETLQAEIFVPNLVSEITPKDITIKDYSNKKIKLGFFLKRISNNYYFIYFDLPLKIKDGNYTLEIKNIVYKKNNLLKETTLSKEFKINSSIQRNLFAIEPAILKFEPKTSYLKLIIKNKEAITLTLSIDSTTKLIQTSKTQLIIPANSQESINIYADIKKFKKGAKEYLNIAHYKIPIWILEGIPITTNKILSFSIIEDNKEIILDELNAELNQNQVAYENIFIKNLLNKQIHNLQISLTGNLNEIVDLNLTLIPKIKPNETITEYILINKEKSPKSDLYSGNLLIKNKEYNIEFPITLRLTKEIKKEEIKEPEKVRLTKQTPKELPKEKIEEKNSFYFIISIIGIIIFLIIIYFIIPKKHH